jgi:hypothetical protein
MIEKFGTRSIIMPASPVHRVPKIILTNWCIYEVSAWDDPAKTKHFVGYNLNESGGQVSSAIVRFNRRTMTGETISGRVYQLEGLQGSTTISDAVWKSWCFRFQIRSIKEINPKSWITWYW